MDESAAEKEAESGVNDETRQELLDIRVLELLQSGAPAEELLAAVDNGTGIHPTDDVLLAVAKKFVSDGSAAGHIHDYRFANFGLLYFLIHLPFNS